MISLILSRWSSMDRNKNRRASILLVPSYKFGAYSTLLPTRATKWPSASRVTSCVTEFRIRPVSACGGSPGRDGPLARVDVLTNFRAWDDTRTPIRNRRFRISLSIADVISLPRHDLIRIRPLTPAM